jgi:retinol-binding protein 3
MRSFVLAAALALLPSLSFAQVPMVGPDEPDVTIDAATRKAVVDSLVDSVDRFYVFPDQARAIARAIRKRMSAHEYDRITSGKEFADSLTAHLRVVAHDLHLRVHYRHRPFPADGGPDQPDPAERARALAEERVRNFGFEKVQRLAGNVGYLELRMFSNETDAQSVAIAAMQFLANTDALIIDLRRNGGGSPRMIATLLTYLIEPERRLNFNNFFTRRAEGDNTEQWWTTSYVPGQRYTGKPIYVLTSNLTGSAAEEFAYDIQTHELGTLVGQTTAGGANPGGLFRLSDHFAAFIATGRAINPITHTNWQGVGVKPEVETKAEEALKVAHVAAIEKLLEKPRDEEHRAFLTGSLARAKDTPPDRAEDFVRRGMQARR